MAAATRDDAAPLSLSSTADLPSFLQRNATRRNFVRNGSCTEAEKSATLARLWGWMGGGNNSNNNEEPASHDSDYDGDDREPARLPRYFLACEAASIILREPPSSSLAAERCPFYEADALRGILELPPGPVGRRCRRWTRERLSSLPSTLWRARRPPLEKCLRIITRARSLRACSRQLQRHSSRSLRQ